MILTRFVTPLLACGVALAVAGPAPAADGPKPNVIILLADDLGWGDLSCYGGTIARTPCLDQMAREGVRFTQAYVASPICSPSRCGIVTGQFPARWRITSYLQTRAGNRACEQADYLDPKAPSLPRALKQAGYATCHIGKWHLGGGRDVESPPKFAAYGYDRGLGTWESPEPHPDLTARDWIWSAEDKVKRWDRTRWMVDQTLAFMKEHPDRPCFVNLWLDDTHTPWVPTAEDQDTDAAGRGKGRGDTPARLRKVIVEMDRQIGRLLDALRDPKAARPTIVLFLGDNGPLPTFDQKRAGGLRGSKMSLYEGGIRVPLIAWGPNVVPAGVTNETTILTAVDFSPTLAAVCGAAAPGDSDGEDLSRSFRGETPVRTKSLYWEYGRNEKSFAYPREAKHRSPAVAVRDGNWKLLANQDGSKAELYDLVADRNETKNLVAEHPDVAKRLTAMLVAWRKSVP